MKVKDVCKCLNGGFVHVLCKDSSLKCGYRSITTSTPSKLTSLVLNSNVVRIHAESNGILAIVIDYKIEESKNEF